MVAERYGRKSKSGVSPRQINCWTSDYVTCSLCQEADVAFDVYRTSCQRMEVDSFHAQGQQVAGEEVKALLEYVQKMPEGPQKAHFMKRVSAIMWIYRISSCLWLSQV